MYTLGYSLPALDRRQVDRRRASILSYVRETARRVRHRSAHPLPPPRRARRVVDATTRAGRSRPSASDTQETVQLTCGFLFMCSGYYRYDEGYTPEFAGIERFSGAHRAPAALDRRRRLRRQARRGDRQRRHRGDARPGAGRAGRARDDAAALAELRGVASGGGPVRQRAAPACCRRGSPTRSCAGRTSWSR